MYRGIKGVVMDKFGKSIKNVRIVVKGIRYDIIIGERYFGFASWWRVFARVYGAFRVLRGGFVGFRSFGRWGRGIWCRCLFVLGCGFCSFGYRVE